MSLRAVSLFILRLLTRLTLWGSGIVFCISVSIALLSCWVVRTTEQRIITRVEDCPLFPLAIVFGTSHRLRNGSANPYYQGRLDAAAALFDGHRIELLLLSGDNRTLSYNEPMTMWKGLRGRGVVPATMTLDYAGFSTFDTLVRAHRVFGVERALLISQRWHLPRALLIARHEGIDAYGFAAQGEIQDDALHRREEWARLKTLWDLYLWPRQPHFLGHPESLHHPEPDPPAPLQQSDRL